jgi:hypothetical protein
MATGNAIQERLTMEGHGAHYTIRSGVWTAVILAVAVVACRPVPRYVLSATPIRKSPWGGLCVAVDLTDSKGVWWWEPKHQDCTVRSSGVLPARNATVEPPAQDGSIRVRFDLPMQGHPDLVEIRFVVEADGIRELPSGIRVPIQRRNDLNIPDANGDLREPTSEK